MTKMSLFIHNQTFNLMTSYQGFENILYTFTTNISIGVVYEPKSIKNLIFTVDWWEIEKKDTIGLFGEDNIMLTDLLLRMESNNLIS